jgi:hypothetical protein
MPVIAAEIERFNRLSATWWDSHGPMRPLHVVNSLRLGYVIEQIALHRGVGASGALTGLRILDAGGVVVCSQKLWPDWEQMSLVSMRHQEISVLLVYTQNPTVSQSSIEWAN